MGTKRAVLLFAAFATRAAVVRADDDPVVVKVGDASLRASDVARRLAALPSFQLSAIASNPTEAKRKYVDGVLVPELLYSLEAKERKLAEEESVKGRLKDAMRRALVESLRKEIQTSGVPEPELHAYYDAHASDYHHPERLRLFRILVGDEASAKKIIAEARGPGGPERWSQLCRDHSVDEATKLRSGALGFVSPDGHTEVPQLAVDPVLVAAAAKVRDGEIVPEPVKEGGRFAVVWRRGTLPKVERSFEAERPSILSLLVRERVDKAVTALIDKLRTEQLKDLDPAPLEALPVEKPANVPAEHRLSLSHTVNPVPSAGERGLR